MGRGGGVGGGEHGLLSPLPPPDHLLHPMHTWHRRKTIKTCALHVCVPHVSSKMAEWGASASQSPLCPSSCPTLGGRQSNLETEDGREGQLKRKRWDGWGGGRRGMKEKRLG